MTYKDVEKLTRGCLKSVLLEENICKQLENIKHIRYSYIYIYFEFDNH